MDKLLGGHFYQNAYVTRDIAKAVAGFERLADVRLKLEVDTEVEATTTLGRGAMHQKVAFLWIGDMQVELIQPVSGLVQLYSDDLPDDDSIRFHHICHRIDDWDALQKRIAKNGLPIVLEGGGDALKYCYVDTRSWLGHYVEFTWMTDEMWARIGGR